MHSKAVFLAIAFTCVLQAQSVSGVNVPAVGGLPFTAQEDMTWTHQVNGQVVTGHLLSTLARDSQGRIHAERHEFTTGAPDVQASLTNIALTDPIAGTRTDCDVKLRVCHVLAFKAPTPAQLDDPFGLDAVARSGLPTPVLLASGAKLLTTEAMGFQTLQNLSLTGMRRITSPVGSDGRPSEDASGQSVVETWYSRDLKLVVSESRQFPQGERQTVDLRILSQSQPDPSLFALPAGFEVKDERKALPDLSGKVRPPIVIATVNPEVSEEAREHKPLDATVVVGLIVDTQGAPQNIHVLRGFGQGLDEKAVEAVRQYRFKPAMMDGKPVAVALNISVRFQIF
jgi:TonB family protein